MSKYTYTKHNHTSGWQDFLWGDRTCGQCNLLPHTQTVVADHHSEEWSNTHT